jgi:hypothetical protein
VICQPGAEAVPIAIGRITKAEDIKKSSVEFRRPQQKLIRDDETPDRPPCHKDAILAGVLF